mgnify:CR=1 FL=1
MDLRLADGTLLTDVPDGMPLEELNTMLYKKGMAPAMRLDTGDREWSKAATEDPGFIEDIATGFGSGAVGVLESGALGLASLLPEEQETPVRDTIQGIAEIFTPEGGDPDSNLYKVAGAVGSSFGFIGASVLGGLVGSAPGALATTTALAAGAGMGEASERARMEGATQQERESAALGGILPGLTDVIPAGRAVKYLPEQLQMKFISDFFGKVGKKAGEGMLGNIYSAGKQGGIEAAQEVTQQTLQNLIAKGIYKPDQEIMDGLGESAALGGAGGALTDLILNAATSFMRNRGGSTPSANDNAPDADTPNLEPTETADMFAGDQQPEQPQEGVTDLEEEGVTDLEEVVGDNYYETKFGIAGVKPTNVGESVFTKSHLAKLAVLRSNAVKENIPTIDIDNEILRIHKVLKGGGDPLGTQQPETTKNSLTEEMLKRSGITDPGEIKILLDRFGGMDINDPVAIAEVEKYARNTTIGGSVALEKTQPPREDVVDIKVDKDEDGKELTRDETIKQRTGVDRDLFTKLGLSETTEDDKVAEQILKEYQKQYYDEVDAAYLKKLGLKDSKENSLIGQPKRSDVVKKAIASEINKLGTGKPGTVNQLTKELNRLELDKGRIPDLFNITSEALKTANVGQETKNKVLRGLYDALPAADSTPLTPMQKGQKDMFSRFPDVEPVELDAAMFDGTGIGADVVTKLVEKHKGKNLVYSKNLEELLQDSRVPVAAADQLLFNIRSRKLEKPAQTSTRKAAAKAAAKTKPPVEKAAEKKAGGKKAGDKTKSPEKKAGGEKVVEKPEKKAGGEKVVEKPVKKADEEKVVEKPAEQEPKTIAELYEEPTTSEFEYETPYYKALEGTAAVKKLEKGFFENIIEPVLLKIDPTGELYDAYKKAKGSGAVKNYKLLRFLVLNKKVVLSKIKEDKDGGYTFKNRLEGFLNFLDPYYMESPNTFIGEEVIAELTAVLKLTDTEIKGKKKEEQKNIKALKTYMLSYPTPEHAIRAIIEDSTPSFYTDKNGVVIKGGFVGIEDSTERFKGDDALGRLISSVVDINLGTAVATDAVKLLDSITPIAGYLETVRESVNKGINERATHPISNGYTEIQEGYYSTLLSPVIGSRGVENSVIVKLEELIAEGTEKFVSESVDSEEAIKFLKQIQKVLTKSRIQKTVTENSYQVDIIDNNINLINNELTRVTKQSKQARRAAAATTKEDKVASTVQRLVGDKLELLGIGGIEGKYTEEEERGILETISDNIVERIKKNVNASPIDRPLIGNKLTEGIIKAYGLSKSFVTTFNKLIPDGLSTDPQIKILSEEFVRLLNKYVSNPNRVENNITAGEEFLTKILEDIVFQKTHADITDALLPKRSHTPLSLRKYGVTRVLSDPVQAVLHQNDLKGAMQIIGKEFRSGHKRLAKALAKVTGTTKIVIKSNLVNANGKNVPGYFSPKENTIYLDQALGMNYHTLMHEGMHMATAHALDPKSEFYNPTFKKRVETIYNEVKDTDAVMDNSNIPDNEFTLDEFLAEYMANHKFQQDMAKATSPKANLLKRMLNTIVNYLRGLVGVAPIGLSTAKMDAFTKIVFENLSPSPETSGTGIMYMEDIEGLADVYNPRETTAVGNIDIDVKLASFKEFLKYRFQRIASFFIPTVNLAEILNNVLLDENGAKTNIGTRIHDLIGDADGAYYKLAENLDAYSKDFREYRQTAENGKEELDIFDRLVVGNSLARVRSEYSKTKAIEEYGEGTERFAAWEEGHALYLQLSEVGKDHIKLLPQQYSRLWKEFVGTVKGNLKEVFGVELAQNNSDYKAFLALIDTMTIDPYVPLYRKGDHWLQYWIGGEYYISAFESIEERNQFIEDNKNKFNKGMGLTNKKNKNEAHPEPKGSAVKAQKDLDSDGYSKLGRPDMNNFDSMPPLRFLNETIKSLDRKKGGVSGTSQEIASQLDAIEQLKNTIIGLTLDTMPASSAAKAFKHRKGTMGYETDQDFVFNHKAYELAHSIISQQKKMALKTLNNEFDELVKLNTDREGGLDDLQSDNLRKIIALHMDKWINPDISTLQRISRSVNGVAFLYTLGFNASSVIVNASQIPLVVIPVLAGETNLATALKHTTTATKLIHAAGTKRNIAILDGEGNLVRHKEVRSFGAVMNFYTEKRVELVGKEGSMTAKSTLEINTKLFPKEVLDADFSEGKTLRELLEHIKPSVLALHNSGQTGASALLSTAGLEETGANSKDWWTKFKTMSGFMFHVGEKTNRQVTAVASFLNSISKFEMDNDGANPPAEKIDEFAKKSENDAQQLNGASTINTSTYATKTPVGRVALMYRGFGISMTILNIKLAMKAFGSEGTAEEKRIARKQIAGIYISSAMFAGVVGMPLVGAIRYFADTFLLGDDDDDSETIMRHFVGDGVWEGGVNYFLDQAGISIDVASRIGLSDLIFHEDRFVNRTDEFDMYGSFGKTILGPAGSVASQILRGGKGMIGGLQHGASTTEYLRSVESLLPPALRNPFKVLGRYQADNGYLTRRGDVMAEDLSLLTLMAQGGLGFQPLEYTRNQRINSAIKGKDAVVRKKRVTLLRRRNIAERTGDWDLLQEIDEDIDYFNERHTDLYPKERITRDTKKRSREAFSQNTKGMDKTGLYVAIPKSGERAARNALEGGVPDYTFADWFFRWF